MSDNANSPAIGFSVQCQVGQERQIVFQSFVPFDASQAELNSALDKVVLAAERQEARVRLPQARKRLEQMDKAHKRAKEDMFRLDAEHEAALELRAAQHRDANRRGDLKPNAQQLAQDAKTIADRGNAETTMKRAIADMEVLREEIFELEQKVD